MAVSQVKFSIVAELERVGWAFEFINDDELKCLCPFHEDHSPSCSVSVSKGVFKCQTAGCEAKGDGLTLMSRICKTTRRVMYEDIIKRYGGDDVKSIDASVIEAWHGAIWTAKPMLNELYARGITNEHIREHRIGYEAGRITIPIRNESGTFVNVRKYLPGAKGADKFKNIKGHGNIRLFMPDQLKFEKVVVCGGELKAIVAAGLLNQHGIGAISLTGGEGNWGPQFSERLKDKDQVWVMLDVDDSGQRASTSRCATIAGAAKWVGLTRLPLDLDKYPHGDINDWVGRENATADMLLNLLNATPEWKPPTFTDYNTKTKPIKLAMADSVDAKHVGKRIKIKGVISAMDTAPYVVPSEVNVSCTRDQDLCALCPCFGMKPGTDGLCLISLPAESPGILEMISTPKNAQRDAIITALSMPRCEVVQFTPTKWYNAEDVRVSPELRITNRTADRVMQPAICVGHGLELNETYVFTGRMFPHPKTQQSTLLISKYKTAQDALSSYKLKEPEELRLFQPKAWTPEAIQDKLDHIYHDLESNVTRIYQRRDMHLMIDLAYHSALLFKFDDKITKGWTEVLVVGDSSQGKSETCIQLMDHYGLGEKVECKNATVAGLLGGLQQMGSKWFVTWGVIPTHDKRLVILEELKGANIEVIAKLTDMRSSGVAEIPKIEKRKTHARTRLVALSNPRSSLPISSYNFGVEAVRELIGGLEDIRRFDLALVLAAGDIDEKKLNALMEARPVVEHQHTSDLCKRLILWAWTRLPEHVTFAEGARQLILAEATALCASFDESIPLVDRGSMRLKIARLTTALACRTFSATVSDGYASVEVLPCHVEYIAAFIRRIYSANSFGYEGYSTALKTSQALKDTDLLKTKILQAPFPKDLAEQLLHTNQIELRDVADWCGWSREAALDLLSLMVRKHALRRDGNHYRKSPEFIVLLKELLTSKLLLAAVRPDYVKEEY